MNGRTWLIRFAFVGSCLWVEFGSAPVFGQEGSSRPNASANWEPSRFVELEERIEQGIASGKMPGCVVCFGRHDLVAYLKAFGNRVVEPKSIPMSTETIFDLASLTKPVATATATMKLMESGQLQLDDPVAKYFSEFGNRGKESITIHHLLIHQSGLIPDNPLAEYEHGPDVAWRNICELELSGPVGEVFKYSDVNFIVLGRLVEKVSGEPLDEFTARTIWKPLGMHDTGFRLTEEFKRRAAPTEKRSGQWIQGDVHDPRAWALNGVAGHAGLFSTASDLARYCQAILRSTSNRSRAKEDFILRSESVERMTRGYPISHGFRGLGWDKKSPYSSNRGSRLSDAAFGHGGFTGTVLWIDPELDLFVIFLSSRLHPDGNGSVNGLAGQLIDQIVDWQIDPK